MNIEKQNELVERLAHLLAEYADNECCYRGEEWVNNVAARFEIEINHMLKQLEEEPFLTP